MSPSLRSLAMGELREYFWYSDRMIVGDVEIAIKFRTGLAS
jgi:hypothetical protein